MPTSGCVRLVGRDDKTFDIECRGVTEADQRAMMGFFCQMGGRFGAFQVALGQETHPVCHFAHDQGPRMKCGPGPHDIDFPIEIDLWAVKQLMKAEAA